MTSRPLQNLVQNYFMTRLYHPVKISSNKYSRVQIALLPFDLFFQDFFQEIGLNMVWICMKKIRILSKIDEFALKIGLFPPEFNKEVSYLAS